MEIITVEDLMLPIEEYATIGEDGTLYEAVKALEKAQEEFDYKHSFYRHRAILVLDKNKNVVGKISQLDVLQALEPKYQDMGDMRAMSRGFHQVNDGKLRPMSITFHRDVQKSRKFEGNGYYV